MTDFTLHTKESAPDGSKRFLKKAQATVGYVPNLYAVQAESPSMLEAYITLTRIFSRTNLTETERQIILMTNNRLNGCDYCMAAHTTISRAAGLPEDVIGDLRAGTVLADPKLEALRQFAIRVNETRGWVDQADQDAFLAAGYDRAAILDVILGTGLKVLSNYTNHVTHTPVDEAFQTNAWSEDELAAA